jgi:hypothetical protein
MREVLRLCLKNSPAHWKCTIDKSTPNTKISRDRTSATITRVIPNDSYGFGSWMITKEDPKGPVKIEILFKDKVVHIFNYVIE